MARRTSTILALFAMGLTALGLFLARSERPETLHLVAAHPHSASDATLSNTTFDLEPDTSPALRVSEPTRLPKGSKVVAFGYIDVDQGTIPLSPTAAGSVAKVHVRDGDTVEAGDLLLEIRSAAAAAQLAQAEAAVREASVHLERAGRAPEDHALRLRRQNQALEVAQLAYEAQTRQVEYLNRLASNSAIPEENLRAARDKLSALAFAREEESLKASQLRLEKPEESVALARASLDAAIARRDLAREHLENHQLRAPERGEVLRVMVADGELIAPSRDRPVLWFCPDRPLLARCELQQEFADRVAVGDRAWLYRDDAGAGEPVTGRVRRVADWIAPRRSLLDEPFEKNDVRTLEVIVDLDPTETPLRIGQRLRVVFGRP